MQQQTLLLSFGFGNLAMLGWLAAAAAPLLIHLWSRHRFREAPWAAMQFLLAAMRKNARRMQLQQWLLLAVRTLIIVLVVLAVAEPYGIRILAGGGAASSHKVVVIDDSYSMDYRDNTETNFARAKQLAVSLVRDSRSDDVFTVIRMSGFPKTIIGPGALDQAAVAAQIETLTESHTSADLAGAISLVRQALENGDDTRKLPEQRGVYFFTDLQRSTWGSTESGSHTERGNQAGDVELETLQGIAKQASVAVIDLGQPQAANLAVMRLATSDTFITPGQDISFDVTLHQFASEPRSQCNVELLVDDAPIAEQTVDVPAGGDATVRFKHRFLAAGSHTICVRAPGDRLDVDNSRWLVVPVREEVRVLCVAGREGAAKYLADALNPNPTGESSIRPVIISEGDFADVALAEFNCVFLCNIAQLTSSESERLARYAAAGGGVVFFLGDRVDTTNYNSLTAGDWGGAPANPQTAPLLPAHIGSIIANQQFGLDPLEYRHPIVAPFRGSERAGLLTTPVNRYYRLDVTRGRRDADVAAALPSGDPFIVTAPLGRGRIVVVATDGALLSVDSQNGEPWTTWPTWPSFLPLVRELLAYAAGGQHERWQQPVCMPLTSRGVSDPDVGSLQVARPDGRTSPVTVTTTPTGREWSYDDTSLSGIYSLRGLPGGKSQQFAVNVNTTESDLMKADAKDLPPEIVVSNTWQDAKHTGTADVLTHSSWNQSLLWAALALMFAESFLAWQFGRGAA